MDSAMESPQGDPRELILLLHGFAESGERILRKLLPAIPQAIREEAVILAPNGPFPMPVKTESGYIATFSWYFYDPTSGEYFIDMKPATEFLTRGLEALGFSELPKRIVGFSQGGFLAPIAAARWKNVRQLIGVGCEYLVDEIPGVLPRNVPYRVDAVHGSQDESVNPEAASDSHGHLMAAGINGSFSMIAGASHRIDDRIREAVRDALLKL
jgi:predicted esterase